MLAYTLSRENLPGRKILNFLVLFTMLFNGGLVATYLVYTEVFHIKNTYWALLIPGLLMNAFNVMLARNFFSNSIPKPLIEAALIDGATEFQVFRRIVIPISLPTSGVRMAIASAVAIPVLAVFPCFERYFVKGIVIGGVKE